MQKVAGGLSNVTKVLLYQLTRRLAKENVDFFKCLILGLRHEQQLVEPAKNGNAAIEPQAEADACHGILHVAKEVGYEPGTEEERNV